MRAANAGIPMSFKNAILNTKLTKSEANNHVSQFLEDCIKSKELPLIIFSGNADRNGNWVFTDGAFTLTDMLGLLKRFNPQIKWAESAPIIIGNWGLIIDSSYSG